MGALGTGCTPDVQDSRDYVYGDHPEVHGAFALPSAQEIDLREYLPPVRSQIAQDCCAHAFADGAYGMAKAAGRSIELPSVLFPYALARLAGRAKTNGLLVDSGSSLREMFRALSDRTLRGDAGEGLGWGLVSEARWPEVAENIDAVPPDDCWREGENATLRGYYAIPDGADSSRWILDALRRLRMPTLAMVVDDRFANLAKDEVYDAPGGSPLGSHALLVVGYSPKLKAFRIRNSWGTAFGDAGYAWISSSYVDRKTYAKWVVDVAPEVSR